MSNTTGNVTIVTCTVSVCLVFLGLFAWLYFWGEGARQANLEKNRILSETCYREYHWSDAHQVHTVSVDYCPAKESPND